jgi:hypothetical protein
MAMTPDIDFTNAIQRKPYIARNKAKDVEIGLEKSV